MDVEKFAPLVGALHRFENSIRAMTWAFENIEYIAKHSEAEIVGYLKRYDLVYGVWLDPEANTLKVHAIKGREPVCNDEVAQANAIPCVDEADARRWTILIQTSENSAPEAFSNAPRLRVATIDGKDIRSN